MEVLSASLIPYWEIIEYPTTVLMQLLNYTFGGGTRNKSDRRIILTISTNTDSSYIDEKSYYHLFPDEEKEKMMFGSLNFEKGKFYFPFNGLPAIFCN